MAACHAGGMLEVARRVADDVLFPAALETDAADAVPVKLLDTLADAGLYGLLGPKEFGGSDADAAAMCDVVEVLAGGCLSTTFVWGQHSGLVRQLAGLPASPWRDAWLGSLCRGERRAGLALGGLLPGPPRLSARPSPGGDGWILDGSSPWVSGWGLVDALLVAARGPGNTLVWILGDAAESPGLAPTRQHLVAADASVTVQLDYAGYEVPAERILHVLPYEEAMYSMGIVLRQNGFLALGVAARCCRLLGPSQIDDELAAARDDLRAAADDRLPAARAAAAELAVRAAAALTVAVGSRSIRRDEHPQRLAREALFLLVFGTRPAIRSSLLERFGAPGL